MGSFRFAFMLNNSDGEWSCQMRLSSLLLVFIVLFLVFPAFAQPLVIRGLDGSPITPPQVDDIVSGLMKAAEVPGVAISIINDGSIVYQKAYGFRDIDNKLPLNTSSVMTAASFTKSTFAYMVMQLVGEGILDLDRPVYLYLPKPLPQYQKYADLVDDDRYKRITARMILDHTTGFANYRGLEPDRKLRIHFAPGTRYAYSGEGILLLQFIVETITGKPLQQLMEERVFRPLGMDRTSMVWESRFEGDYANGYDEYGRSLVRSGGKTQTRRARCKQPSLISLG